MSKMDNLRAMREAKYAANAARAGAQAPAVRKAAPRPAVAPPVTPPSTPKTVDDAPTPDTADELCGHRNIGGRTCTRERGHTAKSHRYS